MALDDPTLLVNVLTRDLRAMTNERDELLQKVCVKTILLSTDEPEPKSLLSDV